jgi:hypothetical protein
MYTNWIKEQLKITNVKVKKWVEWNPDSSVYEAFYEQRKVIIPRPVDDWSFLVALHEIGHISTGDRVRAYLSEYNAEKWAIRRAKECYNIQCLEYEEDARNYVRNHLISDLIHTDLKLEKVKSYVLAWLGETIESLEIKLLDWKK